MDEEKQETQFENYEMINKSSLFHPINIDENILSNVENIIKDSENINSNIKITQNLVPSMLKCYICEGINPLLIKKSA